MPRGIELWRVAVPFLDPHATSAGIEEVRDSVLVRWVGHDGVEGWGECPTLSMARYVTETTDRAWVALTTEIAPALLAGRTPTPTGCPAALGSVLDARADAEWRRSPTSAADALAAAQGMGRGSTVPWCAVLAGIGDPPRVLAERARRAAAQGAAMLKVKVGADPVAARQAVSAVAEAIATDGLTVAADANGALGAAGAVALDDLGLAYLEQPAVPGGSWEEAADLAGTLRTPVALDESITSLDALADGLRSGALGVVSVKPARLGGCAVAAAAVGLAAAAGVDCFVGGMLELGIGRAAALAVASLDGCTLPTDLGPSERYFRRDVCEPLVTVAGRLAVPEGVGWGRTPDPDRLAGRVTDRRAMGDCPPWGLDLASGPRGGGQG